MWLTTLFVMIAQFALMGVILAAIVFALYEWLKEDDEQPTGPPMMS